MVDAMRRAARHGALIGVAGALAMLPPGVVSAQASGGAGRPCRRCTTASPIRKRKWPIGCWAAAKRLAERPEVRRRAGASARASAAKTERARFWLLLRIFEDRHDQEPFLVDPPPRAEPRAVHAALGRGPCALGACGAGRAPLC